MRSLFAVVLKHGTMMVLLLTAAGVQAEWQLRDSATACVLETEDISLHDGYQDTRVRLNINDERLLVITGSNIDTGFEDTALQVDGRAVILPRRGRQPSRQSVGPADRQDGEEGRGRGEVLPDPSRV